jgi:hypothetical protein
MCAMYAIPKRSRNVNVFHGRNATLIGGGRHNMVVRLDMMLREDWIRARYNGLLFKIFA